MYLKLNLRPCAILKLIKLTQLYGKKCGPIKLKVSIYTKSMHLHIPISLSLQVFLQFKICMLLLKMSHLTLSKWQHKNYFQMISKVDGRIVKLMDGVTSNTVSNNICKSSNSITFTITYKLVCSLFSEQCLHQFCLTLLLERG